MKKIPDTLDSDRAGCQPPPHAHGKSGQGAMWNLGDRHVCRLNRQKGLFKRLFTKR